MLFLFSNANVARFLQLPQLFWICCQGLVVMYFCQFSKHVPALNPSHFAGLLQLLFGHPQKRAVIHQPCQRFEAAHKWIFKISIFLLVEKGQMLIANIDNSLMFGVQSLYCRLKPNFAQFFSAHCFRVIIYLHKMILLMWSYFVPLFYHIFLLFLFSRILPYSLLVLYSFYLLHYTQKLGTKVFNLLKCFLPSMQITCSILVVEFITSLIGRWFNVFHTYKAFLIFSTAISSMLFLFLSHLAVYLRPLVCSPSINHCSNILFLFLVHIFLCIIYSFPSLFDLNPLSLSFFYHALVFFFTLYLFFFYQLNQFTCPSKLFVFFFCYSASNAASCSL